MSWQRKSLAPIGLVVLLGGVGALLLGVPRVDSSISVNFRPMPMSQISAYNVVPGVGEEPEAFVRRAFALGPTSVVTVLLRTEGLRTRLYRGEVFRTVVLLVSARMPEEASGSVWRMEFWHDGARWRLFELARETGPNRLYEEHI